MNWLDFWVGVWKDIRIGQMSEIICPKKAWDRQPVHPLPEQNRYCLNIHRNVKTSSFEEKFAGRLGVTTKKIVVLGGAHHNMDGPNFWSTNDHVLFLFEFNPEASKSRKNT